jgi:hypothetical protein
MCENLVSTCGDPSILEYPGTEECLKIGRAGVANARDEDQCFAVHDECVSDCQYWSFLESFYTDAGPNSSDARDAASGPGADAAASDAASATPAGDASTSTGE